MCVLFNRKIYYKVTKNKSYFQHRLSERCYGEMGTSVVNFFDEMQGTCLVMTVLY